MAEKTMPKYEFLWVGDIAYSFKDEKTGKQVQGSTRKAVILRTVDGIPVGIDVDKVSPDVFAEMEVVPGAVVDQIYYDRFGRICGAK